jgi:hypothetical protein
MSTDLFPICCEPPPKMFGRQVILDRLVRELTKASPGHHSVVAPRFLGKTVFLHALAEKLRMENRFTAVIEWDLKHGTPQTDDDFRKQLCVIIGQALQSIDFADLGKELAATTSDYHELLGMVLDELSSADASVLMLWDGFDRPLTLGKLTRNLWDNLRELALKPSLYLMTSSRKELSALIRDEQSVTSDFWNIFQKTSLPSLTEPEVEEMLQMLPGGTVEKGAVKELINWSGGNPVAVCHILNAVPHESSLSNASINSAALASAEAMEGYLLDIWKDLDIPAQDAYRVLLKSGSKLTGEINKTSRRELLASGLASEEGNKISISFRLMAEMLKGREDTTDAVSRLFHSWETYSENITKVLKRRLSQIRTFDERLFRFVSLSLDLLEQDAETALNNLTSIEERALDVIWQRECGPDRCVHPDVISYWTESPRMQHKRVREMMDADNFKIASDRWQQLSVLQLLTGSHMDFDSKARHTPKDAYVLLNAIHSYRNRVQHSDGEVTRLGTAVAALMTCVELLACLEPNTDKL